MAGDADEHADDDALHWAGDELDPPVLPRGWKAKGRGADGVGTVDDATDGADDGAGGPELARQGATRATDVEPAPMGNAALIGLGVLGGVYLLFAFGWVIGGLRLVRRVPTFATDPMYQGALWLAVLAAPIWFVTALVLTGRRRTWVRMLFLVAGAVLLVPWPFLMSGVMAP